MHTNPCTVKRTIHSWWPSTQCLRWRFRLSCLSVLIRVWTMFSIILCSCLVEVVWEFASMAKTAWQISNMFHPIDKDQRLLSIASDIKVLNAWVEKTALERLEKFLKFSHFDDFLFLSFRPSNPKFSKKIRLDYFKLFHAQLATNFW